MRNQDNITPQRNGKRLELAFFVVLFGVLLFCTPLVTIFVSDAHAFPLLTSALIFFGIWLALIVMAFLMSNRLED